MFTFWKKIKTWKKVTVGIIAFFLVTCQMGKQASYSPKPSYQAPVQTSQPKAEKPKANDESVAYKIASFAYEPGFKPQDSTVQAVQWGLDELRTKCTNTESQIGDYIYVAYEKIKEKDPGVSILSVIDGINGSIPESLDIKMDCAEVAAAYVVLTNQ